MSINEHVSLVAGQVNSNDVEDESTNHSDTFQHTGLNLTTDTDAFDSDPVAATKLLKLPNGYDVVAIRESLLSVAPFVSRGNKGFWRRMMGNSNFESMLTCTYHHVLQCISDAGVVHEERLVNIHDSPLIEAISNNFADIYFGSSRSERDIFIPKLAELLCYMIISALQAAAPKHQRMYMSNQFRELLIDWGTEMFGGLRQSQTRLGREWIFQDCADVRLVTTSKPCQFTSTLDAKAQSRAKTARYPMSSVGSCYLLDHSPLIDMYIQRNNKSCNLIKNKLRVTLSHFPSRPLTTLQPGLLQPVRFRERKTDHKEIRQVMRRSNSMRRTILSEFDTTKADYGRDMQRLKESLKTSMRVLNNVQVTRKEAYEARLAATIGTGIAAAAAAGGMGAVGFENSHSSGSPRSL
jgi:hypothetical protein